MKTIIRILPALIVAAMMSSCNLLGGQTESYSASQLIGTWQRTSTLGEGNEVWVYQADKDNTGAYYWGKTWDEGDDVTESDVDADYHGNGWFKWQIENTDLTQIHMLTVSEAGVPKTYTVTYLDANTLKYKDSFKKEYTFTKVK